MCLQGMCLLDCPSSREPQQIDVRHGQLVMRTSRKTMIRGIMLCSGDNTVLNNRGSIINCGVPERPCDIQYLLYAATYCIPDRKTPILGARGLLIGVGDVRRYQTCVLIEKSSGPTLDLPLEAILRASVFQTAQVQKKTNKSTLRHGQLHVVTRRPRKITTSGMVLCNSAGELWQQLWHPGKAVSRAILGR